MSYLKTKRGTVRLDLAADALAQRRSRVHGGLPKVSQLPGVDGCAAKGEPDGCGGVAIVVEHCGDGCVVGKPMPCLSPMGWGVVKGPH